MTYLTLNAIASKSGKDLMTVSSWVKKGWLDVVETRRGRIVPIESWQKFIKEHPKYYRPEMDEETKPDIKSIYYQLKEIQVYLNEVIPQLKELL